MIDCEETLHSFMQDMYGRIPNKTFLNMWGIQVPMTEVYSRLVSGVESILGEQLLGIILFGSVARGSETTGSDIDIAILYKHCTEDMHEEILDLYSGLNLEYDILLSIVMIDFDYFYTYNKIVPFLMNLRKDGILLWTATM